MSRLCLASIVAATVIACGTSPSPPSSTVPADTAADRAAVERAITQWFDSGIAVGDTAVIRRGMTPTAMTLEDSVWYDREAFIAFIQSLPAMLGGPFTVEYSLSDWKTTVRGDVAWTSLRNRAIGRMAKGDTLRLDWRETAVLTRDDGAWRIDRYHSAPVR